ncbi:MAG TPA: trypsin-like peptidase domain-containing protein [Pirellulales bacterium]|nr:trypsin-like peptidase domain-containing protein [Pirellulales bacterium]
MKQVLLCAVAAALGACAAIAVTHQRPVPAAEKPAAEKSEGKPAPRAARDLPAASELPASDFTPDERVNIAVYEQVNRSVVNISTKGVREGDFFFAEVPTEGAGSGSVLDKSGHILTNFHVIEDARQIEVTLFDGSTHAAKLVGYDMPNDVAVLSIEAPADRFFPVAFGDSSRLKVGQRVFAIGNPFGLERTLTTGIISSLNRRIPGREGRTLKSLIQTDAAINPGNSGGPLLDSRGRLIGMNTAIASRTGQNTGVGFAIPVSSISRIVPQLIEKGRVVRPDVGIVKVYETERGLLIAEVSPNGPAEKAGLQGPHIFRRQRGPFVEFRIDRSAADTIVAVDGVKVATADEFLTEIENKKPGDEVTLTVLRGGREMAVRIRLVEDQE